MKKIKKLIKLTNLNSEQVKEKELKKVTGGVLCDCGCYYCECGGSSSANNDSANVRNGLISTLPQPDYEGGMCV